MSLYFLCGLLTCLLTLPAELTDRCTTVRDRDRGVFMVTMHRARIELKKKSRGCFRVSCLSLSFGRWGGGGGGVACRIVLYGFYRRCYEYFSSSIPVQ